VVHQLDGRRLHLQTRGHGVHRRRERCELWDEQANDFRLEHEIELSFQNDAERAFAADDELMQPARRLRLSALVVLLER
jgi:hypothetical protein